MEMRQLGNTGLTVSRLGAGLSEIGGLGLDQVKEAAEVLNRALDGGITFLDTAACYDVSEELIGRTVAHRRTSMCWRASAATSPAATKARNGRRRRWPTASTAAWCA